MGLVWGSSFLFMKVALTGVSFGQVAWARLVLGALTLGLIVLISRQRLPREPVVWLHFLVIGIVGNVLPFLLFAWAEQYVSSSLASIYNAVTPSPRRFSPPWPSGWNGSIAVRPRESRSA